MTPDEIYTELGKLIVLLNSDDNEKLVRILEHRMYKVAWTSSSELLESVASTLNENIDAMNKSASEQAKLIITEIDRIIRN